MVTEQYRKSFMDDAADVMYRTGEGVLKRQASIAGTYYNRRTGELLSRLTSRPFSVMKSSYSIRLVINYLLKIRFLDMKLTSKGKKKKLWYQIYNKPLYGYIYSYAIPALRHGFLENIRENTTGALKSTLKTPLEV